MKLDILKLTNFRSFETFEIKLNSDINILFSKNEEYNSNILDAISISLSCFVSRLPKVSGLLFKDSDLLINKDGEKSLYTRIYSKNLDGVEWDITQTKDKSKETKLKIPSGLKLNSLHYFIDDLIDSHNDGEYYELPVFIYYGKNRDILKAPNRKSLLDKKFDRFGSFTNALNNKNNFQYFFDYFYFLETEEFRIQKEHRSFDIELNQLKSIRYAISNIFPNLSNPRMIERDKFVFDYNKNGSIEVINFKDLSVECRNTLIMVMDISARMTAANPNMENNLNTSGVILVDNIELNSSVEYSINFIKNLKLIFPNIQFIISTNNKSISNSFA